MVDSGGGGEIGRGGVGGFGADLLWEMTINNLKVLMEWFEINRRTLMVVIDGFQWNNGWYACVCVVC